MSGYRVRPRASINRIAATMISIFFCFVIRYLPCIGIPRRIFLRGYVDQRALRFLEARTMKVAAPAIIRMPTMVNIMVP